jgi:hypothetical protein
MVSIDRVKAILMSPKTEWPRIEAEPATVNGIIKDYLVWLAAIPAIATFIGFSVIGFGMFGVRVRTPLLSGIASAVVGLVLSIAMAWVIAKIAEMLAPKFGGKADFLAAFKLVAYGSTGAMVAGAAYVLPALSILALLGAIYSIYLIYLGATVMMKVPQDKALPYTAVLIVCGFVAGLIAGAVTSAFTPSPMSVAGGDVKITTPKGEVSVDTGKLDAFAKKMEEAAKKMEDAQKSGDPDAIGKAAGAAIGAITGAGQRKPIDAATLKAALPESIGDLARGRWETGSNTAMGIEGSRATAEYGESGRRVKIEIVDIGGLSGLMAMAGVVGAIGERETESERERTYKDGKRVIHESEKKSGGRAEYKVVLGNGVMVSAEAQDMDLATLKRAVGRIDLNTLEKAPG